MEPIKRDPIPKLSYTIRTSSEFVAQTTPARPSTFVQVVRAELRDMKANGVLSKDEYASAYKHFCACVKAMRERLTELKEQERCWLLGIPLRNKEVGRPRKDPSKPLCHDYEYQKEWRARRKAQKEKGP